MIIKIKQWCEGIIIAVVISIIIEMIIPDGKNKKYIKVIIGIYIMFASLSPILEFLKYDFNFNEIMDVSFVKTSQSFDNNIKDVYILGIEENLKCELESLGYVVENVKIYTDISYENIEKIELDIKKNNNENNDKIIKLINENYSVSGEKIIFK